MKSLLLSLILIIGCSNAIATPVSTKCEKPKTNFDVVATCDMAKEILKQTVAERLNIESQFCEGAIVANTVLFAKHAGLLALEAEAQKTIEKRCS